MGGVAWRACCARGVAWLLRGCRACNAAYCPGPLQSVIAHACIPPLAPAGLHYDALAVAAFEGAPEQLDALSIPCSGPRADMVMQVGGWKG